MSIFESLVGILPEQRQRDLALTVGGMTSLLAGRKAIGMALFGRGVWGLERDWRSRNSDFQGDLAARWNRAAEYYDTTHKQSMNRRLHAVGIPLILGGAAGLLVLRPYRPTWWVAAGAFTAGWGLNVTGHMMFEKNAPAFADDPLAFVAGPLWDLKRMPLLRRSEKVEARPVRAKAKKEPVTA